MQHSKSSQFIISNLILLFIISFSSFLFAGAPDTLWTRTYGGADIDIGYSVQQLNDGGFIIAGATFSFGAGGSDFYLIRTNPNGDTLWTKTYGGTNWEYGYSIQQTNDGGFVITGYTMSFGAGASDFYLVRTDSKGDTLWTKTYGGAETETALSIQKTSDDGFAIIGNTASFGSGNFDVYLVRTDSLGDTIWTKTYGGEDDDMGSSVLQTSDGGFIIAGHIDSFNKSIPDGYLIRTDSNGDTLWTKIYIATDPDYFHNVQLADGGFIIVGETNSFGSGGSDIYLIYTNSNGDTLWTKTYGGTENELGYSIQHTRDNGFIISGSTSSFGEGFDDFYIIRTNSNGDTLWTKTCGGDTIDVGFQIQQTSDGGFIIVGYTASFGAGGGDVYLIRLDKDTTGIQEDNPFKFLNLKDFIISYTNNNLISIHYTIQHSSSVNLSMYNISGQLVKTLFNEYKNAGDHTINFKMDNISAGVYYFKLTAGESSYTQKAVVVE